jgi:hypothetical protein
MNGAAGRCAAAQRFAGVNMKRNQPGVVSRRGLLRGASAAGVAAVGVVGTGVAWSAGDPQLPEDGPVVVHLSDLASGTLDVYAGTDHSVVTDRALASRLAKLATTGRS